MNHCKTWLACGWLMLVANAVAAAPPGPVVVELFTSQGCNSCPPADALLGELAHRPDVLALALHVTYWNDLGWRDRFSQDQFDQRQRRYAEQLKLPSAYTPQMVVNGRHDVLGSKRDTVIRLLEQAERPAAISVSNNDEKIMLVLPELGQRCDCVLTLFAVQPSVRTPVGRGENAGKTLDEFQVVRLMQSLGKWNGELREIQVKPAKSPAEVSVYAVLAQERITGRVVAAGFR